MLFQSFIEYRCGHNQWLISASSLTNIYLELFTGRGRGLQAAGEEISPDTSGHRDDPHRHHANRAPPPLRTIKTKKSFISKTDFLPDPHQGVGAVSCRRETAVCLKACCVCVPGCVCVSGCVCVPGCVCVCVCQGVSH